MKTKILGRFGLAVRYSRPLFALVLLLLLPGCEKTSSTDAPNVSSAGSSPPASAPSPNTRPTPDELKLALRWLARAKITAGGLGNISRDWAFQDIAVTQARAGDIPSAIATASGVSDASGKKSALTRIALIQVDNGDVAAAKATAGRIADEQGKTNAMNEIEWRRASTDGFFEAARNLAARTDKPEEKVAAYCAISIKRSKMGDRTGARRLLEAADQAAVLPKEASAKAIAFYEIGAARLETGETVGVAEALDSAKNAAVMIGSPATRIQALVGIATLQVKAARSADARETLKLAAGAVPSLAKAPEKAKWYGAIAVQQVKAGDVNGANETMAFARDAVAGAADAEAKLDACTILAVAEVQAGDIAAAKSTIAHSGDGQVEQSKVYANAAHQLLYQGRIAEAKRLADGMTYPSSQEVLGRIVIAQAEAGDVAGAITTAKTIVNEFEIKTANGAIAAAQGKMGDARAAKQTLLGNAICLNHGYRLIAAAQTRGGDVEGTNAWIDSLQEADRRTAVLVGAAEGMLPAKNDADAAKDMPW